MKILLQGACVVDELFSWLVIDSDAVSVCAAAVIDISFSYFTVLSKFWLTAISFGPIYISESRIHYI